MSKGYRTFKDRTSARYNGNETISISVTKRSDANVIDAVEQVLAVVEEASGGRLVALEYSIAKSGRVCCGAGAGARR